jgi:hypothetical protein
MSKYDSDLERKIMAIARRKFKGAFGAYHHEISTFGFWGDNKEGVAALQNLVDKGMLHFNPAHYRDFGWKLSESEIEKLLRRIK